MHNLLIAAGVMVIIYICRFVNCLKCNDGWNNYICTNMRLQNRTRCLNYLHIWRQMLGQIEISRLCCNSFKISWWSVYRLMFWIWSSPVMTIKNILYIWRCHEVNVIDGVWSIPRLEFSWSSLFTGRVNFIEVLWFLLYRD